MNNNLENFDEIIAKAQEISKEKFLKFAKGIYGIDEDTFKHLWEVPIIPTYKCDEIISTTLSTKNEDDIIEILDEVIEDEINNYAVFIPFQRFYLEFEDEEIAEYRKKLENGEIEEKYNSVIVYDEAALKKLYRDELKKKTNEKSLEDFNNGFANFVASIFTHERCHLNANTLVCDTKNIEIDDLQINGGEIFIDANEGTTPYDIEKWEQRNEVLIETLASMIHNYEYGDTVKDCLYKIIEARGDKPGYDEISEEDEKMVLSSYIIAPEKLTEWIMLGAYEDIRVNFLKDKITKIFGSNTDLNIKQVNSKIKEYCENLDNNTLSTQQIKMFNIIGIKDIERQVTKSDFKDLAISVPAIEQLNNSEKDIKSILQELLTKDNKNIQEI